MAPTLARRLAGRPLLLLLDIDGTLSPIAQRPADAIIPEATRRVLSRLVATPDVHVAIVSGRAAHDARRMVDVAGMWIIGNHGIEVAPPNRTPAVREDIARYANNVDAAAAEIAEVTNDLSGVIVENKRWTLSVHYRLASPSMVPELTARVVEIAAENELDLTHAKKTLELRPPVEIDKGTAALELAGELGALSPDASLLCAGDDLTDEDMFRALRAAHASVVTVWVAHDSTMSETAAEFTVPSTDSFRELLETILNQRRGAVSALGR